MLIVTVAAAAALIVIASTGSGRSPPRLAPPGCARSATSPTSFFVCVKAIEGIVDVLARHGRLTTGSSNRWAHRGTRQSRYDSLGQDEDDRFELGDDDEYEPDDERF